MPAISAAVLAAFATLLAGGAFWVYVRREVPVRGRTLLAALRAGSLLVVLLLLWNPALPTGLASPGAASEWILVDRSTSMEVPGEAPVRRVVDSLVPELDDPPRVLGFRGGAPRPLDPDTASPAAAAPAESSEDGSRIAPLLERAAEAGAARVWIVSDLRLEDVPAARAAAERLGLTVDVIDVGTDVRNAGVATFDLPAVSPAADSVPAGLALFGAEASAGDSARVVVREGGREVASRTVRLPEPGLRRRIELRLPPPTDSGDVRYEAVVELAGDAFARDDRRAGVVRVAPEEGGVVLVSLAPDWEPRSLLPVLGEVTGLRTSGFLRTGEDRWLVMDAAGAGGTAAEDRVARAAGSAELLVVQLGGREVPPWLRRSVSGSPRTLLLASAPADLPLSGSGSSAAGAERSATLSGEWYVSAPGAGPVASALAGRSLEDLPPVGPLLAPSGAADAGAQVALTASRGGASGAERALLLLGGDEGRARATLLAPGLWRWHARPGEGRAAYRALWSGVAGWLLQAGGAPGGAGTEPVRRVQAEGEPLRFRSGGPGDGGVRLALGGEDGTPALDTLVVPDRDGQIALPPLPAGAWTWRTETPGAEDGSEVVVREGRLVVERWSGDLESPRVPGYAGTAPAAESTASASTRAGVRPLRTHPLPYVLVLLLLCAEWVLRRRRGLR